MTTQYATTTIVIALLFAVLVVVMNLPAPTPSLNEWTEWAGKVVGILVAARVLWAGATLLEAKAKNPPG